LRWFSLSFEASGDVIEGFGNDGGLAEWDAIG
jgi:hypothetical protein